MSARAGELEGQPWDLIKEGWQGCGEGCGLLLLAPGLSLKLRSGSKPAVRCESSGDPGGGGTYCYVAKMDCGPRGAGPGCRGILRTGNVGPGTGRPPPVCPGAQPPRPPQDHPP